MSSENEFCSVSVSCLMSYTGADFTPGKSCIWSEETWDKQREAVCDSEGSQALWASEIAAGACLEAAASLGDQSSCLLSDARDPGQEARLFPPIPSHCCHLASWDGFSVEVIVPLLQSGASDRGL